METEEFYLLDLERTISNKVPYFWNGNRHGYTSSLQHAGLFSRWTAEQIVQGDYDQRTVMISQKVVFNILGKDMKPHEGSTITSKS
jgi:hypothetical protein